MKAIDTNVLARALMRDDPSQTVIAEDILRDGAFVSLTVLLETAWLLRSRYGLSRIEVVDHLTAIAELPGVTVDEEAGVRWALQRLNEAGDIADLIHLVAARRSTAFLTFDRGVARSAGPNPPIPIETLA